ncbi:hypothetical protein KCU91_g20, partial [Aureobasidium melanogenum]
MPAVVTTAQDVCLADTEEDTHNVTLPLHSGRRPLRFEHRLICWGHTGLSLLDRSRPGENRGVASDMRLSISHPTR